MPHLPASLDRSIERLSALGLPLFLDGDFLVAPIPLLDHAGNAEVGYLVESLNLDANRVVQPEVNGAHQMHLVGIRPHEINGSPLPLSGSEGDYPLTNRLRASFHMSIKLKDVNTGQNREYADLFEKFSTYYAKISAPGFHKKPKWRDGMVVPSSIRDTSNPFVFPDTAAHKDGVLDLRERLLIQRVLVVGAGGTGSFLIDLLARTPIGSMTIVDFDRFWVHNLYRAPGPYHAEDIGRLKSELAFERARATHKYVSFLNGKLEDFPDDWLRAMTFVFLCVDKVDVRRNAVQKLSSMSVPFIDCGLGMDRGANGLQGMCAVTLSRPESRDRVLDDLARAELVDVEGDYRTFVQTSDLNAFNAALAIIQFKKFVSYYSEFPTSWQSIYSTQSGRLVQHDI